MLLERHAEQLPPAPTFGSAGEPPPPATPWIPIYWGLFDAELMESDDVDAVWRASARTEAVSILSRNTDVSLTEGVDDTFLTDRLDVSRISARLPGPRTGPIEDEPRYKEGLAHSLFSVVVQPPTDPIGSYRLGYEEAREDPSWGGDPDIDLSIKMSRLMMDSTGVVYDRDPASTHSPKARYLGQLQAKLQITDDSPLRGAKELRRLDHAVRWVRRDPVDEIPPGVTSEVAFRMTVGVTEAATQSLARALGLTVGVDLIGVRSEINRQLTATVSTTLSLSQTEETTKTLTLTNQSESSVRLYALWQLRNRLRVSRLDCGPEEGPAWKMCSEEEFLGSDAVTIKSFTFPAR